MKQNKQEQIRKALMKDFKELYKKEFSTAWRENRMIRNIEIGIMRLENIEKLISQTRQEAVEEIKKMEKGGASEYTEEYIFEQIYNYALKDVIELLSQEKK